MYWLRGFRLRIGLQDPPGLGARKTVDQKPFDPGGTGEIASFCRSSWIPASSVSLASFTAGTAVVD
jgi:hypothetical protein